MMTWRLSPCLDRGRGQPKDRKSVPGGTSSTHKAIETGKAGSGQLGFHSVSRGGPGSLSLNR